MPKDTFFNLPKEKRLRIETAAIKEFEACPIVQASINRICVAAEIPKGSFYQYFENKEDLYGHILECFIEAKIGDLMMEAPSPEIQGFFDQLQAMFTAGIRFGQNHPEWVRIGERVMKEPEHPIHRRFLEAHQGDSKQAFEEMIKQAIDRGELKTSTDVSMLGSVLQEMGAKLSVIGPDETPEAALDRLGRLFRLLAVGVAP